MPRAEAAPASIWWATTFEGDLSISPSALARVPSGFLSSDLNMKGAEVTLWSNPERPLVLVCRLLIWRALSFLRNSRQPGLCVNMAP